MPLTPDDLRLVRFSTGPGLRSGYRRSEVDALLAALGERMESGAPVATVARDAVFRTERGGYSVAEVDAFLSLVVALDATRSADPGETVPAGPPPTSPTSPPAPFVEPRSWLDRLRGRG